MDKILLNKERVFKVVSRKESPTRKEVEYFECKGETTLSLFYKREVHNLKETFIDRGNKKERHTEFVSDKNEYKSIDYGQQSLVFKDDSGKEFMIGVGR